MIFFAPQSHGELVLSKKKLVSTDGKEDYSVIKGIPVLLTERTNPEWNRELLEIIFWEYPEAITKIYEEINGGRVADWNEIYIKYIKEIHTTKENILKAFQSYKQKETDVWITGGENGNVTKTQIKQFKKFSKKVQAKKNNNKNQRHRSSVGQISLFRQIGL